MKKLALVSDSISPHNNGGKEIEIRGNQKIYKKKLIGSSISRDVNFMHPGDSNELPDVFIFGGFS